VNDPRATAAPSRDYAAKVTKIHDGDTIEVLVDVGFYAFMLVVLRFYGINAPELSTPEGKASLAYLKTKLKVGDPVLIQTYKYAGDKYGRWLAIINKPGDTVSINQRMVNSNHAVEYLPK
jgi:micrococcal nuclease